MSQRIYNILMRAGFKPEVMQVVNNYAARNRFYHDFKHIEEMLDYVDFWFPNWTYGYDVMLAMRLAIIFHDVIYDVVPKNDEFGNPLPLRNEERSFEAYTYCVKNYTKSQTEFDLKMTEPIVKMLIMATKHHDFDNADELAEIIIRADLDRFTRPFPVMWGHYLELFKEFGPIEFSLFKNGRAEFLAGYRDKLEKQMNQIVVENINKQITVLETWKPKIAIYPGSFKPYHVGHDNILKKAERIFDKVIIACGKNPNKDDIPYRIPETIRSTYQVDEYNGLLTDYVASKEYPVTVIRGLRDIHDLTAEITQYHWLQELMPHVDVVSIFCDRDYEHVSSSAIRALEKYKGDFNENPFFEKFRVK